MIYISHRGNTRGKDKNKENSTDYIKEAIDKGFDVEIDVWFKDNSFYLGHDFPEYKIDTKFLINEKFWCHAKNIEALTEMKKLNCHFFWHENDSYTITSKGYIWTYPGKKLSEKSICVLPESFNFKKEKCVGICSDYIETYKNDKTYNI